MEKKIIIGFSVFALMILMIFIIPVYADTIQDYVQQQIGQGGQSAIEMSPQELFIKALLDDPAVKAVLIKFIIFVVIFSILFIIDLILRGITMWKASKRNQKTWFWFLLIVNSLCILPLIYLIIYRNSKPENEEEKKKK
ncbi:MAG: DUF5652 family protein [Nanoarchaeota archaeon]